jgi:hypothetical protein
LVETLIKSFFVLYQETRLVLSLNNFESKALPVPAPKPATSKPSDDLINQNDIPLVSTSVVSAADNDRSLFFDYLIQSEDTISSYFDDDPISNNLYRNIEEFQVIRSSRISILFIHS